jgi:methylglyoxal synthase
MNIALIAHDNKKNQMINFTIAHKHILQKHSICTTGTTGKLVSEVTGLEVTRYLSGPLGGDQQIGAEVAKGLIDLVIFMRDPLTAQPHEPDITALMRICDVRGVPLATNIATAEVLLKAMDSHAFDWKSVALHYDK